MKEINTEYEENLGREIKATFPEALITKKNSRPGMSTPDIIWNIAPVPLDNIEVRLSKYRNYLVIAKYLIREGNGQQAVIYSGKIPVTADQYDTDFVCKLLKNYQYIAP